MQLSSASRKSLLEILENKKYRTLKDVLVSINPADLLEEMPANVVKRILEQTESKRRNEINEILRYPEDSAGSIMTTEYVSFHPGTTVAEAIDLIRKNALNKETKTALMCGTVLAAACFVKIMLIDRLFLGHEDVSVSVALVVCITVTLTVIFSKLLGCVLPMMAKKAGLDPAVMASPLITTISDAISLLIYFGIASLLLF